MAAQRAHHRVSEHQARSWREWIEENIVRGVSSRRLESALLAHGFPSQHARAAVRRASQARRVIVARSTVERLAKLESLLDALNSAAALSSDNAGVDRRAALTHEEFLDGYYSRNRPVLLHGMISHWPALVRWT